MLINDTLYFYKIKSLYKCNFIFILFLEKLSYKKAEPISWGDSANQPSNIKCVLSALLSTVAPISKEQW